MRSLGRILAHVANLWPWYLGIVICSLASAGTALAVPFVLRSVTDLVVAAVNTHAVDLGAVVQLAAVLLAFDLANTVTSNIGGYLGDNMAMRLRAGLSKRYFDKLLGLPQRYFDDELSGTIIGRLSRSITEITQFMQSFSNNFFPMLLTVGAVLVITAHYSVWISLLLLAIFPLYVFFTALTSRRWQRFERRKNAHVDQASGRFAEVISQMRVVKSFVQERREYSGFSRHYDRTVALTRPQSRWWHSMDVVRRGVLNVVFFVIYLIIFLGTARSVYSLGTMVMLVQMVGMARQPATMMSFFVDQSQRAVAGSRDYFEVLAQPSEHDWKHEDAPAPALIDADAPMISFRDIGFGYGQGPDVVEHISFDVARGERLALVSESGGGKTTLVSLLMGLYRPRQGQILVGGHDTSTLGVTQLRAQVGVVFQEPLLFSGTVSENIAYADPDVADHQIRDAAKRANADAFIRSLPHGYASVVGERGLKLSGGQKQRIAVARAMIKDALILVLDEATSALDSRAEQAVQNGLEQLMEGRTSIIIAHRLSTIATVDRIVTMRGGRVDEIGSPAELAASGGIYAQLLALQASGRRRDRRRLKEFDITH
ncbi:ABC transporter ATP-binding protein [Propionibacterium freudenreichii]|uniref:Putative ABC transporter ATP-binding protein n=1 Tax=Propionibacterium freudenreichii subsp. freudenreichii TaxID=66712 RepID=A0A0B7NSG4_PROFF|nr:ABC transporter ATP-binding protein [Propionibacterium freudenreichii]CEP26805.1 Putative ABC transporter ATP-binding protein [Propionibacterium freudenreichii subsp. freudenreichii]MCT2973594.1 ABC transporter ATP-binding protein [Propionibacterium freudenreichii]MCT2995744.1 ABC transporter ATP-binding protein [Propionibacterium freudenreichii]MCT2999175.1 ABC transporter ATP-binding protein [Propionibacterium freudenreichii]MCT3011538.1 ABC transporter ATP-binding protein [Propionibacter